MLAVTIAVVSTAIIISTVNNNNKLDFKLEEVNNGYTVVGLENDEVTSLVIPSKYKNKPIISIKSNAFYNSKLKSVKIGDNVTTINDNAFRNCYSLKSVTMNNKITNIGDNAFDSCSLLTNLIIPSTVINIGDYAFYNCTSINNVTIPNSVKSIGKYAFYRCYSLTRVTFENKNSWYRRLSATSSKTYFSSGEIGNQTSIASALKGTYSNYYWGRD